MSATLNRPPGRYGEEQPTWYRAGARGFAVALALLAVAWVVWAGLANGDQPVTGTLITYTVVSDSRVEYAVDVSSAGGAAASCQVQAMGPREEIVGVATATAPASKNALRRVVGVVTTQQHARAARLAGCDLQP